MMHNSKYTWKMYKFPRPFIRNIRGLSQNSVDWVYNFKSIQSNFIQFLHNVNYTILYQNSKFQVCIKSDFCRKFIISK